MIVTIEEARETMCPILTVGALTFANGTDIEPDKVVLWCHGPRCMAWRTVEPSKGFCGMVPVWPEFKRKTE